MMAIVIDRNTEWRRYDGQKFLLCNLEDTHLANIIRWVQLHDEVYPTDLLPVLLEIAEERGLTQAFLDCAEIPHRNAEGKWMLNFQQVG